MQFPSYKDHAIVDDYAMPKSYGRKALLTNVDKYGYFNRHPADKPTVQFDLGRDSHFSTVKPA
jgi:hypothetical protein